MDELSRERAASFGRVAATYEAHRPGYPDEAVRWLTGRNGDPVPRVLELAAGTGKLTRALVEHCDEIIATDNSAAMLARLRAAAPDARTALAAAESIPFRSSSFDLVVAAQAFHWFDPQAALPEIARVLRAGALLSITWNVADYRVPWVRRLFALCLPALEGSVEDDPVRGCDLFQPSEHIVFRHWQRMDREALLGFVGSQSRVVVMAAEERDDVLEQAGLLYDEFGRGPDGLVVPWQTTCFRARVTKVDSPPPERDEGTDDGLLIRLR